MKRIAFRTKGNHKQGLGDLLSSIALAHKFSRSGYDVVFLIDHDQEAINTLKNEHYRFSTIKEKAETEVWEKIGMVDVAIANRLNSSWEILSVIRRHANKLITIDDTGNSSRELADLRINPLYYDEGALCGFKYIPLSPVFQAAHKKIGNINEKVRNILVSLGGSDTYGFTPKIVKYLTNMELDIQIKVLLGPAFRHHAELNATLDNKKNTFEILHSVDTKLMYRLMSQVDLIICSGGITMFEAACLGIPAIIVCGELFEEETAQRLMDLGIVINLGFGKNISEKDFQQAVMEHISDHSRRKQMSQMGLKTIDGRGIERIYHTIVTNGGLSR